MPFESHRQREFLELMNEKTKQAQLSDEELTEHMRMMLNHLKQKNVYLSDLLFRIHKQIEVIPKNKTGMLLIEAAEALQTLVIGGGENKCRSNRKHKADS